MMRRLGLDWRISLAQECWFYFRTCHNWRQVCDARLSGNALGAFKLRNGCVISFNGAAPFQIFQEIWRYHIYTRAYSSRPRAPRLIVDIGANIGFFTLYAASRWRKCKVYAYEPAFDNFDCLKRNVSASGIERIHLSPLAVSARAEERAFYLKEESGWHSLWSDSAKSSVMVQSATLESIVAETGPAPIDFLKVDCEGAEYEILAGRQELLRQSVRYVAMEYHEVGGHRVDELLDILSQAHFTCKIVPQPRWQTGMLYARNKAIGNAERS